MSPTWLWILFLLHNNFMLLLSQVYWQFLNFKTVGKWEMENKHSQRINTGHVYACTIQESTANWEQVTFKKKNVESIYDSPQKYFSLNIWWQFKVAQKKTYPVIHSNPLSSCLRCILSKFLWGKYFYILYSFPSVFVYLFVLYETFRDLVETFTGFHQTPNYICSFLKWFK